MDGRPCWVGHRRGLLGLGLLLVASSVQAVEPKAAARSVPRSVLKNTPKPAPPATNPSAPQGPVRVASLAFIEPGGKRVPLVEVFSNGRVQAIELRGTRENPTTSTLTDQLAREELQELHHLLIQNCQLGTQTTESTHRALQIASQQRQLTADINGAAATEIGVLTPDGWKAVSCPAVSILITRFPDIVEVQNIATAQSRLMNIAAVAMLGGAQTADLHAATATHKLRETHPEAGEITRRDLTMVRRLPNGSRFVQFHYVGVPGKNNSCLVSVTQNPDGPTRVSVMNSPTVVR